MSRRKLSKAEKSAARELVPVRFASRRERIAGAFRVDAYHQKVPCGNYTEKSIPDDAGRLYTQVASFKLFQRLRQTLADSDAPLKDP
jgi:hypothetical protein